MIRELSSKIRVERKRIMGRDIEEKMRKKKFE